MFVECPLCGAVSFYLEDHPTFVSFKITQEGHAADVGGENTKIVLTPETTVNCVTCAWYGEVRELTNPV